MILKVLQAFKSELEKALGEDNNATPVILAPMAKGGNPSSEAIVVTLLTIEEEGMLRNSPSFVRATAGEERKSALPYNLYTMVSADFTNYDNALQKISAALQQVNKMPRLTLDENNHILIDFISLNLNTNLEMIHSLNPGRIPYFLLKFKIVPGP